jgi:hypothetical protein
MFKAFGSAAKDMIQREKNVTLGQACVWIDESLMQGLILSAHPLV